MRHEWVTAIYSELLGPPALQVWGRGSSEPHFHPIRVYATDRRNFNSGIPLMQGTCITWTSRVIAVGWDFAEELCREQGVEPATPERPRVVASGRLNDPFRRHAGGAEPWASCSEVMAHECGHTAQARRMGGLYWLVGGALTLCREGPHWWNRFENQASEEGQFGGVIPGTACPRLRRFLPPGW